MKKVLIFIFVLLYCCIAGNEVYAIENDVVTEEESLEERALTARFASANAYYIYTIGTIGQAEVEFTVDGNIYYNSNNGNYVTNDLAPYITYHDETLNTSSSSVTVSIYSSNVYLNGSYFYMTATLKYIIDGTTYYTYSSPIWLNIHV